MPLLSGSPSEEKDEFGTMYMTLLEYSGRFSGVARWAALWKTSIQTILLSLLGVSSVFSMWNSALSPSSWVVVSLNMWCACLALRGMVSIVCA